MKPMTRMFGKIRRGWKTLLAAVSLSMILIVHLAARGCERLSRARFLPGFLARPLSAVSPSLYAYFASRRSARGSISRLDLIDLSLRNMDSRKTRTRVTVGGMMIGIGMIVLLVSVGFGLQRLVIERVASLEEMKQFDVLPPSGEKLRIDDGTLADVSAFPDVVSALPMISVVGHVDFSGSVADMAAYGVTTDFLRQSAIRPSEGRLFESDAIVPSSFLSEEGTDAAGSGVPSFGMKIGNVDFAGSSSWVRVRESPSVDATVIGYTRVPGAPGHGEEYWGDAYDGSDGTMSADGTKLGRWIRAEVPLWESTVCDPATEGDCEDGRYSVLRDDTGVQVRTTGYFAEIGVETSPASEVNGNEIVEDDRTGTVRFVNLSDEAESSRTVSAGQSGPREAVLSRAAVRMLGIEERDAVGRTFSVSFVVVGDLLPDSGERLETFPIEYEIVGVIPGESAPLFYVPFSDLRSLGIVNFSQLKVAVADPSDIDTARKRVESSGYVTRSVADTVEQIDSLFGTARIVLAFVGMTALLVAALGMFNTLTVSLLERTREVGLMKAMGMRSDEIRELFLTESMIMSLFGGVLGLLFGYLVGKGFGLILSSMTYFRGIGFVDVSSIPASFATLVLFLSVVVGFTTGIYPARRATRISALDALRYE